MSLSFVNSNWRRRYPFKATASMQDVDDTVELSNDVLVGCRLSSIAAYADVYIAKVWLNKGKFSLEFVANNTLLGVANGTVTSDNQSFKVKGLQPFFSGYVVIGSKSTVAEADRHYRFTSDSGAIEASLVTVYPAPGVPYIKHQGRTVKGDVSLELTNLDGAITDDKINFSVITPLDVISRQDFTAELLTCKNPVIGSINSVEPGKSNIANEKGNIDIIGIKPVVVTVTGNKITIGSGDLSLEDICKKVTIPPENPSSQYYMPLEDAVDQEWKSWPIFNPAP